MSGRIYNFDSPADGPHEGGQSAQDLTPLAADYWTPDFLPPRPRRLRPTSFAISIVLHLATGFGVWVLDGLMPALRRPEPLATAPPEIRVMRVIALSPALMYPVQRPVTPTAPAAAAPPVAASKPVAAARPITIRPAEAPPKGPATPAVAGPATEATAGLRELAALSAVPEPPRPAPAKPFQTLPVLVKKTPRTTTDLLIQPDIPDLPVQEIRAPEMVLVNETRNPRRTFIRPPDAPRQAKMPGQIAVDIEAPKLGTDPNGLMTRAISPQPLLTAPKAARFPVAVPQAEAPPQNIATVGGSGTDLPNIISIPSQAVPRYDQTVLPPAQSGPKGAFGTTVRPGDASPPGGPASGGGGGGGAGQDVTVAGGASASGPGGRSGVAPAMPAARTPLRIERPRTGRYDVAITNAESGIPGSAGLLRGRPVYTVYISVGLARDWILQYAPSASASGAAPRNGTVVTLDATPAPLSAPYAFTMLRPPVIRVTNNGRYGFVHAIIGVSGKFEDLRIVGPYGFEDAEGLLRSLGQWEFRPAARDGAAIAVEVLLCVPNS